MGPLGEVLGGLGSLLGGSWERLGKQIGSKMDAKVAQGRVWEGLWECLGKVLGASWEPPEPIMRKKGGGHFKTSISFGPQNGSQIHEESIRK